MDLDRTAPMSAPAPAPAQRFARATLLDALLARRSRRFGAGMRLDGGPLAYASARAAEPLTLDEEAVLAFAACGVTGSTLAELPFDAPEGAEAGGAEAGGGNIIVHFVGRTLFSADAAHLVTVFVLNDDGTWLLKRPQDYPRTDVPELVRAARDERWGELYGRARVRVAVGRADVPRAVPYLPPFNKWSANVRGATYFLPVAELSGLFINILLAAFGDDARYFVVDERNTFRPAGLRRFARSRGGHLEDDPARGRTVTLGYLDSWLYEFAAVEQGAILQNLALASAALGLGGFPHLAAHPFAWFQALGFRMAHLPFSRAAGAGPVLTGVLRALGKDRSLPMAVGLERDGEVLLQPFCPPYYRSMEEAVLAYVDYKYAPGRGTLRDGGAATDWRDGAAVQAGIPAYADRTVEAAIACCDYIYRRYGRLPGGNGPFRTLMAYQAHHLDLDFYRRFYRPEVAEDMARRFGA